tara:strand:- start:32 stop:142 length:111 start_codon:yes stop_codon:yes gene_type:complete
MIDRKTTISIALLIGKIVVLVLLAAEGDGGFIYQNF